MKRKLTFLQSHRSFLGGRMVFKTQSPLFDHEIDPDSDQARFEFSGKNPSAPGTTRNFTIVEAERLTTKKFLQVLEELRQKNCLSSDSLEAVFSSPPPLLITPYLSTQNLETLEQHNLSGVDFCGNGILFMERIFYDEKWIQKSVQVIAGCHEESLYGRGCSGCGDIVELQFLSHSEAHMQFHPKEIRPDFIITSE